LHWHLNTTHHQHSENVSSGTAECRNDKDKQREQPVDHEQTFSPYGLSSPSELDSDESRALWKSILRTRKMDGKKVPARQIQHPSPKGVEVSAVRGFQVKFSFSCTHLRSYKIDNSQRIIVHKRKRKAKSLTPISSNPTFLVDAGGSSQVAPSSYGDLAHAFISSQGRAGSSSQRIPIAGHASRSWSTVTNCTDDSYSDCSTIQGPWLRFLDKICFSC